MLSRTVNHSTRSVPETRFVLVVVIVLLLTSGCRPYDGAQPGANVAAVVVTDEPRAAAFPEQAGDLAKLGRYLEAVASGLDKRAQGALLQINGTSRRLLALRGYIRGENILAARWSWTAEEIKRFEASAEYSAALNEVEKVRQKFAELNPGYELYVNKQVRTLERQIKSWNETKSVETAGERLLAEALSELSGANYAERPDASGSAKFRRFLEQSKVDPAPTVATPGLSLHGQLRAFDFQIQQGDTLVAGTESSTIGPIWDARGWTRKLNEAVTAASRKFKGPLASPREPWHYEYVP
jgi:hypothetical protein